MKYFLITLTLFLSACASIDVFEDTPKDDTVITAPYGAEEFCIEYPKSELCEEETE